MFGICPRASKKPIVVIAYWKLFRHVNLCKQYAKLYLGRVPKLSLPLSDGGTTEESGSGTLGARSISVRQVESSIRCLCAVMDFRLLSSFVATTLGITIFCWTSANTSLVSVALKWITFFTMCFFNVVLSYVRCITLSTDVRKQYVDLDHSWFLGSQHWLLW